MRWGNESDFVGKLPLYQRRASFSTWFNQSSLLISRLCFFQIKWIRMWTQKSQKCKNKKTEDKSINLQKQSEQMEHNKLLTNHQKATTSKLSCKKVCHLIPLQNRPPKNSTKNEKKNKFWVFTVSNTCQSAFSYAWKWGAEE